MGDMAAAKHAFPSNFISSLAVNTPGKLSGPSSLCIAVGIGKAMSRVTECGDETGPKLQGWNGVWGPAVAASLLPVSGELNVQMCSLTPGLKLSHFR
jgi:hypothetical protein